MKIRPLSLIIFTIILFASSFGILIEAEDIDARITKAANVLSNPATSKEKMINSLVEFLDITIYLTASSKYRDEIKHHLEIAKDLFKNSSIFNDKAHQYISLAYRMVTGGVKYQKPPDLDEFITPAEAQEKGLKYSKKLVEEARASVIQGNNGIAAKHILKLVLLIVTPIKG
jgi:hypothetical protein